MKTETLVKLVPLAGSLIVPLLSKVLINPGKEEGNLSKFRVRFLETIRLEVALELSNLMPVKKPKADLDDYTPLVKERLIEYLEKNSAPLIDFHASERIWSNYICWLRIYKYSLLVIPTFGLFAIIALCYYPLATWLVGVGTALVLAILLIVFVAERFKDKYMDLCNKYEVVDI